MKKLLAVLGILAMAAFTTGCGNACDDAVDHIEDCGIDLPDGTIDTDECSDKDECVADCVTDASCETLKGEDMQGALDYAACVGGC